MSAQNQSSKVERNETTDTDQKTPILLLKNGETELGISRKSAQSQSSKSEKNKTTDREEKTPNPLCNDGDMEPGISTK